MSGYHLCLTGGLISEPGSTVVQSPFCPRRWRRRDLVTLNSRGRFPALSKMAARIPLSPGGGVVTQHVNRELSRGSMLVSTWQKLPIQAYHARIVHSCHPKPARQADGRARVPNRVRATVSSPGQLGHVTRSPVPVVLSQSLPKLSAQLRLKFNRTARRRRTERVRL
jgi:hypothetical protein